MSTQTPGTNRFSKFLGGTYRNSQWYCSCDKEATYVRTGKGENAGQHFYKCGQDSPCRFWLWVEHEPEARRRLAASMSPEPQTPSRPRQSGIESRSQSGPSTRLESAARGNPSSAASDRVLRSARQATPTSSQADRSLPRPQTPDDEDGLATRVINLLEGYNIRLSSKEKRKLQVLIDDYIDEMETDLSLYKEQLETRREVDEDGYVVD